MADDTRVLEVRTYRIHESSRDQFDPNAFVLVRSFESLSDRDAQKAAFYGSAAWKDGIEDQVMSCIDTYLTAVVPATAFQSM